MSTYEPRSASTRPATGAWTAEHARDQARRHIVLTFAVSWLAWIVLAVTGADYDTFPGVVLFLLGGFGPLLAAVALWWADRSAPRRNPFGPRPRGLRWVAAALTLGAAPAVVGMSVSALLGGPATDPDAAWAVVAGAGGPLGFLALSVIAGPLSEEPGWRGYAQWRLHASSSRLRVAMVFGGIWAAWHVPLFFVDGTSQSATGLITVGGAFFVVTCFPLTYLLGAVYERWHGGVAAAVLLHFAANATNNVLAVRGVIAQSVQLAVLTGAVVVLHRSTTTARERG